MKSIWGLSVLLSLCGISGICGSCVTPAAHAQTTDAPQVSDALLRAIVTPEAALIPLPAEVVCGPKVESVSVSPKGTYALIVRRTVYPARDVEAFFTRGNSPKAADQVQEGGAPEIQLLLWGPGSRSGAPLSRWPISTTSGFARVDSVDWLSDTALVLVTLVPGPVTAEQLRAVDFDDIPTQKKVLLRVKAATGKAETLLTTTGDARLVPSLMGGESALITDKGQKVTSIIWQGTGTQSFVVPLDPARSESAYWQQWEEEGRYLRGLVTGMGPDKKPVRRQVVLSLETGKLIDYDTYVKSKPNGGTTGTAGTTVLSGRLPERFPPKLPYAIIRGSGTLSQGDTTTRVMPLWIQGQDAKSQGRGLLSADVDASGRIYPLTTGVLYPRQGTLFATPLLSVPVQEFQARRQEQLKQDTLKRAHLIGSIAWGMSMDAHKPLPEPGDLAGAISDFVRGDPTMATLFQNPATGKEGFTTAYTSASLASAPDPAKVVLGYLAGPSGRAVIYYNGDTKWEDAP